MPLMLTAREYMPALTFSAGALQQLADLAYGSPASDVSTGVPTTPAAFLGEVTVCCAAPGPASEWSFTATTPSSTGVAAALHASDDTAVRVSMPVRLLPPTASSATIVSQSAHAALTARTLGAAPHSSDESMLAARVANQDIECGGSDRLSQPFCAPHTLVSITATAVVVQTAPQYLHGDVRARTVTLSLDIRSPSAVLAFSRVLPLRVAENAVAAALQPSITVIPDLYGASNASGLTGRDGGRSRGPFAPNGFAAGILTLDASRRAVPLLATDPLAQLVPVIGIWVRADDYAMPTGASSSDASDARDGVSRHAEEDWVDWAVRHPGTRAAMLWYMSCPRLRDRAHPPGADNTALVIVFPPISAFVTLARPPPAALECSVTWPGVSVGGAGCVGFAGAAASHTVQLTAHLRGDTQGGTISRIASVIIADAHATDGAAQAAGDGSYVRWMPRGPRGMSQLASSCNWCHDARGALAARDFAASRLPRLYDHPSAKDAAEREPGSAAVDSRIPIPAFRAPSPRRHVGKVVAFSSNVQSPPRLAGTHGHGSSEAAFPAADAFHEHHRAMSSDVVSQAPTLQGRNGVVADATAVANADATAAQEVLAAYARARAQREGARPQRSSQRLASPVLSMDSALELARVTRQLDRLTASLRESQHDDNAADSEVPSRWLPEPSVFAAVSHGSAASSTHTAVMLRAARLANSLQKASRIVRDGRAAAATDGLSSSTAATKPELLVYDHASQWLAAVSSAPRPPVVAADADAGGLTMRHAAVAAAAVAQQASDFAGQLAASRGAPLRADELVSHHAGATLTTTNEHLAAQRIVAGLAAAQLSVYSTAMGSRADKARQLAATTLQSPAARGQAQPQPQLVAHPELAAMPQTPPPASYAHVAPPAGGGPAQSDGIALEGHRPTAAAAAATAAAAAASVAASAALRAVVAGRHRTPSAGLGASDANSAGRTNAARSRPADGADEFDEDSEGSETTGLSFHRHPPLRAGITDPLLTLLGRIH